MKPLINNKNVDIEFSALIIQRLENLKMYKKKSLEGSKPKGHKHYAIIGMYCDYIMLLEDHLSIS